MTIAVRHARQADAYLDSDEHALQRLDWWRRRLRDGPAPDGDVLHELFAVEPLIEVQYRTDL